MMECHEAELKGKPLQWDCHSFREEGVETRLETTDTKSQERGG